MPTLKQLTATIEHATTPLPFHEFGTTYADGVVESHIAIPPTPTPTPFAIRLTSTGYIAPGLAMFVFIDGVYQCNRNRDDLERSFLTAPGSSGVNFRVRQKEEQVSGGGWVGRPWRFEPLRLVSDDVKPPPGFDLDQPDLNHLGTIHIFVLRCQAANDPGPDIEDGTLTPESGMEPLFDFEDAGIDLSKLRLSTLSPIHFDAPTFASFDGPWEVPGSFPRGTGRGNLDYHPRKPIALQSNAQRQHSYSYCANCAHCTSSSDETDSPDTQDGGCDCTHCRGEEDATDASPHPNPQRGFGSGEKIMFADPAPASRPRRHTHAHTHTHAQQNYPAHPKCARHKHHHPRNDENLAPRSVSYTAAPTPQEPKQTPHVAAYGRRSRHASHTTHPPYAIDDADPITAQTAYPQSPTEYLDPAGNRVVVPPIVVHITQPPAPAPTPAYPATMPTETLPYARETRPRRTARTPSASSGCYIIRDGRRVPSGWGLTGPSTEVSPAAAPAPTSSEEEDAEDMGGANAWTRHGGRGSISSADSGKQWRGSGEDGRAWWAWINGGGNAGAGAGARGQSDGHPGSVRNLGVRGVGVGARDVAGAARKASAGVGKQGSMQAQVQTAPATQGQTVAGAATAAAQGGGTWSWNNFANGNVAADDNAPKINFSNGSGNAAQNNNAAAQNGSWSQGQNAGHDAGGWSDWNAVGEQGQSQNANGNGNGNGNGGSGDWNAQTTGWDNGNDAGNANVNANANGWNDQSAGWNDSNGNGNGWDNQAPTSNANANTNGNNDTNGWGDQASSWNNGNDNGASDWNNQASSWDNSGNNGGNDWDNQATTTTAAANDTTASNGWNNQATTSTGNDTRGQEKQDSSWDVNCPGAWTDDPVDPSPPIWGSNSHNNNTQASNTQQAHSNPEPPKQPPSTTWNPRDLIVAPDEDPLYAVPRSVADSKGLSHQMQPGPEISYAHRVSRPRYIDSLEAPYAKFVFHYRGADVIEKKFGVKLTPTAEEERKKLEALPKTEILDRLLVAQGLLDESHLTNPRVRHRPRHEVEAARKFSLPRNADEGVPLQGVRSAINFGPPKGGNAEGAAKRGGEDGAAKEARWSAGQQGFFRGVEKKLQAFVEGGTGKEGVVAW